MPEQRLAADGRWLVVATDHPLYSWPCHGLEDRNLLVSSVTSAGADAVIATYGTIRDCRQAFGDAIPILKLDLSNVYLGNAYPESEFTVAWSLDDARRLGVRHVLTYVQIGSVFELEALKAAARIAAGADAVDMTYICEPIPVESERFPDPQAPVAVAAAVRAAVELGAHVVKTSFPDPISGLAEATAFGVPVIVAGGDPLGEPALIVARVEAALAAGAAGAAVGRNVWGASDPAGIVQQLRRVVHPRASAAAPGWLGVSSDAPGASASIAIVTGAGSGIGRASSVLLAAAGVTVMAVGRRAALLESLCAENPGVFFVAEALDTPAGCARVVERTVERLGTPSILVHAAGLGGYLDLPIWDETSEAWRATMAINLDAAFELVRLTAPSMCEAHFGRIVLVGSTAGSVGAPAMSAYSASKAGLVGLMRSVACDVAPFGVTCNAVLPTWVRGTEMAELDAQREAASRSIPVDDVWRERAEASPAKRVLEPSEVAAVICFLATPAAGGVNGAAVDVTLGNVW